MEEQEPLKPCPYCRTALEIKNGLLWCPHQKLFIGNPAEYDRRWGKQAEGIRAKQYDPKNDIKVDETHEQEIMPQDAGEYSLSGVIRRFFSVLIDLTVLSMLVGAVMIPLEPWLGSLLPTSLYAKPVQAFAFSYFLYTVPFWGVAILYFTALEGAWGATIGKRILGERVVTLAGEKAPFSKILIRNIVKPFDLFFFGFLFLLLSSKNQLLGDRLAGTLIARKGMPGTPLTGAPAGFGRKLLAGLAVVSIVLGAVLLGISASKIEEINTSAFEVLYAMKEARDTGDTSSFYQMFAPQMREGVPFEEFDEAFQNNEYLEYIDQLNMDTFVFYEWHFTLKEATLTGDSDGLVGVEMVLLKNEAGLWEPFSVWVY